MSMGDKIPQKPPMDKRRIREGYDKIADKVGLTSAFYRDVIKEAGLIQGRVLDVGCGNGFLLDHIRRQHLGVDVFGCDFSWQLCKNSTNLHQKGIFVQGDGEELPFLSNIFDAVFITEVLEHIIKPESVLLEIRRVLKPNGKLVLSVPNRDWFRYDKYVKKRKVFQPIDDHWFTREELKRLLVQSQFEIQSTGGHGSIYFSQRLLRQLEKKIMFIFPKLRERMKRLIVVLVNLK